LQGGTELQRLLSAALLVVTIIWIVFSHLPPARALLPAVTYPGAYPGDSRWMAAALLLSFGTFLAVQFWLLRATVTSVRRYQQRSSGDAQPLHLRLSLEALWTAVPVVMTFGLAWVASARWVHLAVP
jgi:heme/copper-type cytochrome/quinol oxidase subunit 2